jgi:hypothetical protein
MHESPYSSSRVKREILHFQLHAKKRFLAIKPEMTIVTQPLMGEDSGEDAEYFSSPHSNSLPQGEREPHADRFKATV